MIEIKKEELANQLKKMNESGYNQLKFITAVDYKDKIVVVYLLHNYEKNDIQNINVTLSMNDLSIQTVMDIYPSADWYEREISEMFGIKILSRKTKRLLLENWNGSIYPLRKDFVWGTEYKCAYVKNANKYRSYTPKHSWCYQTCCGC